MLSNLYKECVDSILEKRAMYSHINDLIQFLLIWTIFHQVVSALDSVINCTLFFTCQDQVEPVYAVVKRPQPQKAIIVSERLKEPARNLGLPIVCPSVHVSVRSCVS